MKEDLKLSPREASCRQKANDPSSALVNRADSSTAYSDMAKSPAIDINGIDWMAQQNGGAFDPVLYGDYRDPQDNIINNNAFGDFFNDAFSSQDFGTPYHTGEAPPKKDLMQEIEVQKNASPSELGPKDNPETLVTCDKLWFVHCAFAMVVIGLLTSPAL